MLARHHVRIRARGFSGVLVHVSPKQANRNGDDDGPTSLSACCWLPTNVGAKIEQKRGIVFALGNTFMGHLMIGICSLLCVVCGS